MTSTKISTHAQTQTHTHVHDRFTAATRAAEAKSALEDGAIEFVVTDPILASEENELSLKCGRKKNGCSLCTNSLFT